MTHTRTQTGAVYRVTYRRMKWNQGRESRKLFFTQNAAERFAERLQRTTDVSPIEYADVSVIAGVWVPAAGHTVHEPGKRNRRKFVERTVGDWSEEDDEHA